MLEHRTGEDPRQPSEADELRELHEEEQQVQDTYAEMGVVGDKDGEQVYEEEVARGELSRGARELAHGEFGPGAYEWEDQTPPRGDGER